MNQRSLLALSVTAFLAACGGGGGGDSSPTSAPAATPTPAPVAAAPAPVAVTPAPVEALPTSYAIPDSKFEAVLVAQGLDDVVDGKISTAKALLATKLVIRDRDAGITNLAGLEAFRNLTYLDIQHQAGVTRVDTTLLIKLQNLSVWDCPITSIDVSKNSELLVFSLSETDVNTVDISALTKVQDLMFSNTTDYRVASVTYGTTKGLVSLDVSKNVDLVRLTVGSNRLTSIDTSHNPKLTEFWGYHNQFTSLDFSKGNPLLWRVVVTGNPNMTSPLAYLNLKNTNMTANTVNVAQSQVTSFNNPLLKEVHVSSIASIQAVIATRPTDLIDGRAIGSGFVMDNWTTFTEQ